MFEQISTPLDHIGTTGPVESTVNPSQLDKASGITTDLEVGPSMQRGNRRKAQDAGNPGNAFPAVFTETQI